MISEVVMPQMGADMTEGTLVKWLKSEGDAVERGEIIAEIETDKANVEIEAFESGVFRKALADEGAVIEVGGLIGIIAGADDDVSKYETEAPRLTSPTATTAELPTTTNDPTGDAPSKVEARMETGAGAEAAATGSSAAAKEVDVVATTSAQAGRTATGSTRPRVSPVARRMAEEAGVDLRSLTGTGPDGRIIKRDVQAAMKASGSRAPAPRRAVTTGVDGEPRAVAPTKMRQAIARRMSQSKREAPHYYLLLDIDMTAALETRVQYNAALTSGDIAAPPETKVSINDMLVRAAALALVKHPEFNATIADNGVVTEHPGQNVCIAVALDDGLIAPAVLDAAAKTLAEIAVESADLAARAKGGKLRAPEINNGTFTITNLGAYGVETLIGIIQPPQTAILGAGTVLPQPAVRDGQVVVRQVMKVALSADHRATDGAQGAQFLSEVKRLLESPVLLIV